MDKSLTGPGDWRIISCDTMDGDTIYGFEFVCPCGNCPGIDYLPITLPPKQEHSWEWDGNKEHPTLSPSILRLTNCKWHGYFQAGKWNWLQGSEPCAACLNKGVGL